MGTASSQCWLLWLYYMKTTLEIGQTRTATEVLSLSYVPLTGYKIMFSLSSSLQHRETRYVGTNLQINMNACIESLSSFSVLVRTLWTSSLFRNEAQTFQISHCINIRHVLDTDTLRIRHIVCLFIFCFVLSDTLGTPYEHVSSFLTYMSMAISMCLIYL